MDTITELAADERTARIILATVSEPGDAVTGQMIRTLMDSHERIMNLERMRAIEAATLEALAEVSDDMKEQFLVRLEKKLAEIE